MVVPRELKGAEYPPRLRDLETPPRVWVVGELPRGQCVAIVGTRKCTPEGYAFAHELAKSLAERGIVILSGGAEGIDTAAHEGALAGGSPTVIVAPSSFDCPFPEENEELFKLIIEKGGAHLSRYESGETAFGGRFFQRNTVLAALADAVVVVQTGVKGGSRHTATAARKLGRPLLVVPGAPWEKKGIGCVVELRLGGIAVGSFRDVLKAIRPPVNHSSEPETTETQRVPQVHESTEEPDSNPELAAVRRALFSSPGDVDDLHSRTGIPVGRLRGLLLTLTLDGVLVSSPAGQLSLIKQ